VLPGRWLVEAGSREVVFDVAEDERRQVFIQRGVA